jgi:soluble P-type ATPase
MTISKPGVRVEIPGFGDRCIKTVLSDYTGTHAYVGKLRRGIRERLVRLAALVDIHVLTSDTYGTAAIELAAIPVERHQIDAGELGVDELKKRFAEKFNLAEVAAFGNGNNDHLLLRAVRDGGGLSVAVDNGEGCATTAMSSAHIFIVGSANALDLLLYPKRCTATLRTR